MTSQFDHLIKWTLTLWQSSGCLFVQFAIVLRGPSGAFWGYFLPDIETVRFIYFAIIAIIDNKLYSSEFLGRWFICNWSEIASMPLKEFYPTSQNQHRRWKRLQIGSALIRFTGSFIYLQRHQVGFSHWPSHRALFVSKLMNLTINPAVRFEKVQPSCKFPRPV